MKVLLEERKGKLEEEELLLLVKEDLLVNVVLLLALVLANSATHFATHSVTCFSASFSDDEMR